MRLVTKLLLSFLTVAFLVLITGSLSYYFSNEIKNELINESSETAQELQRLTEMTVVIQNSLLYTRTYITESSKRRDGDESLTTVSQMRRAEQLSRENMNRFEEIMTEARMSDREHSFNSESLAGAHQNMHILTDSLNVAFEPYRTLIYELFELEREEGYGEEIFNVTIEPYFRNTLLPLLQQLRVNSAEFVALQRSELEEQSARTAEMIMMITIFAFIIAMVLALIVYRSIASPIKTLTTAAKEIGDGNLENRIDLRSNDELGKLAESFNQMAENLSSSMVSRSYVNNIIQSMGDMLLVSCAGGDIQISNKAVYDKLHYSNGDFENFKIWSLFKEEDRPRIREIFDREVPSEDMEEIEILTKEGETIPVIFSHSPIYDKLNDHENHVFVFSDITKQKESEKRISDSLHEKNILLAEIHHRVKNNLAVISGMLQMQMWNIDDEVGRNALQQSQFRIQSIAIVHEKLYQNETFAEIHVSDFLTSLVDSVSDSFDDTEKEIDIEYDLDDIAMNINQSIPFSLLINECIVNCYKHAFNGRDDGEIKISAKRDNSTVHVLISDNGSGLPDDFDMSSQGTLGLTLIRTLVSQLKGEGDYRRGTENGTVFELQFSLDKV